MLCSKISTLALGLFTLRAYAGVQYLRLRDDGDVAGDNSDDTTYDGGEDLGCQAYGVDFQGGGSYFTNISSPEDFSFVSLYENCLNDTVYNILVDPNGDETECDNTQLLPSDTNQVSFCPIQKSSMWSGDWGVIIMSNNAGGDPIGFERDFELIVGIPTTFTITPTATLTSTTTPLTSVTTTTTTTSSTTTTLTTTQPAKTNKPTHIVTPLPKTVTRVWTLGTIRTTAQVVKPVYKTKTITETCSFSTQATPDPTLTYTPSSVPPALSQSIDQIVATTDSASSAAATTTAPPSRGNSGTWRRVPADRAQRISARKERIASMRAAGIVKRAPDASTTSITADPSLWPTVTSIVTAATSTISITSVVTQVQTLTAITTLLKGTTTLPAIYITLPTQTRTDLRLTVLTTTVATVTKKPTYTVTTTTAPATATSICTVKGGRMQA